MDYTTLLEGLKLRWTRDKIQSLLAKMSELTNMNSAVISAPDKSALAIVLELLKREQLYSYRVSRTQTDSCAMQLSPAKCEILPSRMGFTYCAIGGVIHPGCQTDLDLHLGQRLSSDGPDGKSGIIHRCANCRVSRTRSGRSIECIWKTTGKLR